DIVALANHFAKLFAIELGLKWTPSFCPSALAELQRYDWPGNVRELKNVVERAVYPSQTSEISLIILNPFNPPFDLKGAAQTRPSSEPEDARRERVNAGVRFP